MALTKMKRAFIAAYCEDPKLGQADAARRAGCSVKRAKVTAYEWMRDPEVKLEIQRQLTKQLDRIEGQAAKRELTPDTVLQLLDEIAEMCKTAGAGAWQAAGLLRVVEFRGKFLKMWTERIEIGADDKLIALLEAGRKRAAGIAVPELSQPPAIEGETVKPEPAAASPGKVRHRAAVHKTSKKLRSSQKKRRPCRKM